MSLIHKKLISTSRQSEEDTPEGKLVHFYETVPMSTYLSCFIVSDFTYTETSFDNKEENDIDFRVYATPAQLNKTTYAAKVGKEVIEFYVDYFNISYPLPKLDMVAIPDFVSGAMEHWGLVTYRETALLYSNDTHSSSNQQRVAEVVAHELAHSWFGNLGELEWLHYRTGCRNAFVNAPSGVMRHFRTVMGKTGFVTALRVIMTSLLF